MYWGFYKSWKNRNHGVATVTIVGLNGEIEIGEGNIMGEDSDGEPTLITFFANHKTEEGKIRNYDFTVKRFDCPE
jgi:hypothetical protein